MAPDASGLKSAHRALAKRVMGLAGVTGTAIGEVAGKPCLKVYLSAREAPREVPREMHGFRVVVERTGGFSRL